MKLKHTIVSSLKRTAGLVAGIMMALLALTPPTLHAGEQIPFRIAWDANLVLTPLAPPFADVAGVGVGRATHLGRVAAQSIEEVVNLATLEGEASYLFTAANGDQLFVKFVFVAIPIAEGVFSIQGKWQTTGGTGRFEGATGAGRYVGHVSFTGETTADGRFEAEGSLSSPGSLK
jgi:hypothetical protein